MNRRDLLKRMGCCVAGAALAGTGLSPAKEVPLAHVSEKKPNIVFFMIDDMGWRDVGFMGSTYYETPNIDRLAAQGVVFTQAYANAANCAPTRASFLTGQYTPRHGVFTVGSAARGKSKDRRLMPIKNDTTLNGDQVTMAEVLGPAGYTCASMGKWPMGNDPELGPLGQGFDVNVAGNQTGSPKGGHFSPYKNPQLLDGPRGEYLTDRLTDEAIGFIEQNKSKPFFLYLTHYAVHTPIQAKADLKAKYQAKSGSHDQNNPAYAAMVDSVDKSVQRVLKTLDNLKLTNDTVVCFFSDNGGHGGATSNTPLRGAKGMFYEGGIRVPMMVRWPGNIKSGTTCDTPVISIDFFPTLLEIAQVRQPQGKALDGLSLMPLLMGTDAFNRDALYWHFPAYLQGNEAGSRDPKFRTRPVGVMRKGRWKLLQYFEEWVLDGGWDAIDTNHAIELYDLTVDPYETHNLATTNKAKRDELLRDLIQWQNAVNAPIPFQPNPEYQALRAYVAQPD